MKVKQLNRLSVKEVTKEINLNLIMILKTSILTKGMAMPIHTKIPQPPSGGSKRVSVFIIIFLIKLNFTCILFELRHSNESVNFYIF